MPSVWVIFARELDVEGKPWMLHSLWMDYDMAKGEIAALKEQQENDSGWRKQDFMICKRAVL